MLNMHITFSLLALATTIAHGALTSCAQGGLPAGPQGALSSGTQGGLSAGTQGGLSAGTQNTTQSGTLGAYNVDADSVSVSGMSAGGFMAAQLGIAYSDVFKVGFGVFAGGPFDCARNQAVCPMMAP